MKHEEQVEELEQPGTGRAEGRVPVERKRTATALTGFFVGLVVVLALPSAFAALLSLLFDQHTVAELFPLVLVVFAVPVALIAVGRTRLLGRYMLIGMLLTSVVVLGVAAAVVWLLMETQA